MPFYTFHILLSTCLLLNHMSCMVSMLSFPFLLLGRFFEKFEKISKLLKRKNNDLMYYYFQLLLSSLSVYMRESEEYRRYNITESLCYGFFGEPIKAIMDKHFNTFIIVLTIIFALSYVLVGYLF